MNYSNTENKEVLLMVLSLEYLIQVTANPGTMFLEHHIYQVDMIIIMIYTTGNISSQYHPNRHAPAAQSDEYWQDQDWESHMISHPTDPRVFRPYPELPAEEPEKITYEKSRQVSDFFLKLMEAQYKATEKRSRDSIFC